jgi:hypothetical protein
VYFPPLSWLYEYIISSVIPNTIFLLAEPIYCFRVTLDYRMDFCIRGSIYNIFDIKTFKAVMNLVFSNFVIRTRLVCTSLLCWVVCFFEFTWWWLICLSHCEINLPQWNTCYRKVSFNSKCYYIFCQIKFEFFHTLNFVCKELQVEPDYGILLFR